MRSKTPLLAHRLKRCYTTFQALREIAPWNARPISEKNSFHEQPVIRRRATNMAFTTGQKILDPIPLIVA